MEKPPEKNFKKTVDESGCCDNIPTSLYDESNESIELPETKRKLVDAGVRLMRARGYNATTVDEICVDAGVTKGGFFHYFKSKDDIAKAAVAHFLEATKGNYEQAPFRKLADPLDRVFGRLDFVKESIGGKTM